jgi:hypothetical protein
MKCEVSVFIRKTTANTVVETSKSILTIDYLDVINNADHCDVFALFGTNDLLFLGKTNNFIMILPAIERKKIETLTLYKFNIKA